MVKNISIIGFLLVVSLFFTGNTFATSQVTLLAQAPTTPSVSPTPSPSPSPTPSPSGTIGIPRPSIVRIHDIGQLIGSVGGLLLIISAVITFIFLIMGGLQWITSGGDKSGMEGARGKIVNAIVGLIIVASAWAIMILLQNFLGISIFGGAMQIPKAFIEASPSPSPATSPSPTS